MSERLPFRAKKALGQNFLPCQDYLQQISAFCLIDDKTDVIEIGPGLGYLTNFLISAKPHSITAVEKDEQLYQLLNTSLPKCRMISADALELEWEAIVSELKNKNPDGKLVVVGNLPYNIANQLLIELVTRRSLFDRFVFVVQKEVAQRWVASPLLYKSKYSHFSVFINYFCETKLELEIPRKLFKPIPAVDGGLVTLSFRKNLPLELGEEKFFTFVKNCFRARRKTLFNNLKNFYKQEKIIKQLLTELGWDSKIRPQDLTLSDYLLIFRKLF